MIGLIMLGSIINYLTRSTLGGRGADAAQGSAHHRAAVFVDPGAFQGAIMLQPLCGYVLDVLGLKIGIRPFRHLRGRSSTWHTASLTAGRRLPGCAGLLGLAEGSANPAGMKATAEWFPGQGTGVRGRPLQHRRLGRVDARAAARRLGHSALQLADRVRDHGRARAGLGGAVAVASTTRPRQHPSSLGRGTGDTSSPARRTLSRATARARRF